MGTNSGPKKRAIPGSTLCVEDALLKYKEVSLFKSKIDINTMINYLKE